MLGTNSDLKAEKLHDEAIARERTWQPTVARLSDRIVITPPSAHIPNSRPARQFSLVMRTIIGGKVVFNENKNRWEAPFDYLDRILSEFPAANMSDGVRALIAKQHGASLVALDAAGGFVANYGAGDYGLERLAAAGFVVRTSYAAANKIVYSRASS